MHVASMQIMRAEGTGGATAVKARVTRSMALMFDIVLAVQVVLLIVFGLWVWAATHSGSLWSNEPAGAVHSVITKSLGVTGTDQVVRLLLSGYIFASVPLSLFPVSEAIEAAIVGASGAVVRETSDGVQANDGMENAGDAAGANGSSQERLERTEEEKKKQDGAAAATTTSDDTSWSSCLVSRSTLPGHEHEVTASWAVSIAVRLVLVAAVLAISLRSDRLGKLLALVGWLGLGGTGFAAAPVMYLLWYRERKLQLAKEQVAVQLQSWWLRTRAALRRSSTAATGGAPPTSIEGGRGVPGGVSSEAGADAVNGELDSRGDSNDQQSSGGGSASAPVVGMPEREQEQAVVLPPLLPAAVPPFPSMHWGKSKALPTGSVQHLQDMLGRHRY